MMSGLPMIKRMLFGFFSRCAFARTAPTSSRMNSISPISLTACCTTSRISGYVAPPRKVLSDPPHFGPADGSFDRGNDIFEWLLRNDGPSLDIDRADIH